MMKFTVLVENQEACGLEGEHGLSFYIEYNGRKLLLDAGQSAVFVRNAEKLGCDLAAVEAAVLSHAHYDHAGGFEVFFRVNQSALLYARAEGKALDCWSIGEKQRYIGIPEQILQEFPERFVWTEGLLQLYPGVWLVPHSTPGLEKIGERTGMYRRRLIQGNLDNGSEATPEFKIQADATRHQTEAEERANIVRCEIESGGQGNEVRSEFVPDDFAHEQSLVIESKQGLVIFNSCSHGGVANIVEEVRRAFPGRQICAYVGGFHLKAPGSQCGMNCSEEEVEQLGRSLLELGIRRIYTGHCTGERGFEILKSVMGECLQSLVTGAVAEI